VSPSQQDTAERPEASRMVQIIRKSGEAPESSDIAGHTKVRIPRAVRPSRAALPSVGQNGD
jgi:hypothetical protein